MIFQIFETRLFWGQLIASAGIWAVILFQLYTSIIKGSLKLLLACGMQSICFLIASMDSLLIGFLFHTNIDSFVRYSVRDNGVLSFFLIGIELSSVFLGIYLRNDLGIPDDAPKYVSEIVQKRRKFMMGIFAADIVIHGFVYFRLYHFFEAMMIIFYAMGATYCQ